MAAAPGSSERPYTLAVVGGGPAAISIFVRAARFKLLPELMGPWDGSKHSVSGNDTAGVVLIESGGAERLGRGRLGDYNINSNTFACKFVRNVLGDKPGSSPPEGASGTILEPLRMSAAASELVAIGQNPAPLPLVGQFLGQVGAVVKAALDSCDTSACLCDTKVVALQQAGAGWCIEADRSSNGGPPKRIKIYASKVVLAVGGRQETPLSAFSTAHQSKVVSSDNVLSRAGMQLLQQKLGRCPKVAIVGGSHSAFSTVWMCLNRIDFGAPRLSAVPSDSIKPAVPFLPPVEKNAAATEDGAGWGAYSISVLHRSAMQVFYNSKREAEADGYTDYKQVNKHGQIHSFGGLRCDAKRLFNDIRKGQDSRVRLFQVKPGGGKALTNRLYDDADVIVWACGYQSNMFPVCDKDGVEIKLRHSGGQARACAHALMHDSQCFICLWLRSKLTTTHASFASALTVRKVRKRTRLLPNKPRSPIRGPRQAAAARTSSSQASTPPAWASVCPPCMMMATSTARLAERTASQCI
jgi:hypothetical protein